jgi:hypothetical protein
MNKKNSFIETKKEGVLQIIELSNVLVEEKNLDRNSTFESIIDSLAYETKFLTKLKEEKQVLRVKVRNL